jgi:hypothetical protein
MKRDANGDVNRYINGAYAKNFISVNLCG